MAPSLSYKLSAVLSGHSSDARALAAQGNDLLVSGSHDGTGRIWKREGPNEFAQDNVLVGHKGAVRVVTIVPPTTDSPNGLVATGGADNVICLWDPTDFAQPAMKLTGHSGSISALAASCDGKTIVSGSWDSTAKVWVDGVCTHTLVGHQHTVWAVLVLDDGSVITGSADKSICLWVNGQIKQTFSGHTDCVRALALLPGGNRFASASNDTTVRIWSMDGKCQAVLHGHSSFIYALSVLPDGAIVSGGEDRTARVWKDGKLAHTIFVPSTSVWDIAALDNGDIACGTSDGLVRIFTRDKARAASAGDAVHFAEANAAFMMSKKTIQDFHPSMVRERDQLSSPGETNEQVIFVRSGSFVEVYQWEQDSGKWIQVGQVSDAAGQAAKKKFDGKEYDYVFDVDIQEGAPPLKLPFNATENPYTAAQKFLEKNGLSLEHLDTVADFITKNADGVTLGDSQQQSYADPFTGGSRYVPNQAANSSGAAGGYGDPFTGGNRYVPSGGGGGGGSASTDYVPPSEYVLSKQGNVSAIIKKLTEFNFLIAQDAAASPMAFEDAQMQSIKSMEALSDASFVVTEDMYKSLLHAALKWPKDKRFPALDLLRLVIVFSRLPALSQPEGKSLVECVGEAAGIFELPPNALAKQDEINLMMGVRALSNAFATKEGGDLVWADHAKIIEALEDSWMKTTNKNLVTAVSNLYLNLAIAATKKNDDDGGLNILSAASRFLNVTNSADAQLRLVNVFGVLSTKFQLCKDSARILGDTTIVILGINGGSDAVKDAAKQVGTFLSA
ncbi:WD repeat protein Lub1 [Coemansia sp. RSA 1813]|nr:WD repeat protein Lub1 [Coemansia sp. RSA 1843]KAJ2213644.1 WD repeat protein Lub1 [Coemansia sp. RSA 487]KAJ2568639.1 WD repeat protein Lub1 [Coemansia sp. RSA 1813]